jgi:hypothetical protein
MVPLPQPHVLWDVAAGPIIQRSFLPMLSVPNVTSFESWHLQHFPNNHRTTCDPPQAECFSQTGPELYLLLLFQGPSKVSGKQTGPQTLDELWKMANSLSIFYFHTKGELVYLKQVDLLWNT